MNARGEGTGFGSFFDTGRRLRLGDQTQETLG